MVVADYLTAPDPLRNGCWIAELDGVSVGASLLIGESAGSARLAYFAEAGHAFRVKVDRCFARSWTVGAQRRRGFLFLL